VADQRERIERQEKLSQFTVGRDLNILREPVSEERYLLAYNELNRNPDATQKMRVVFRNKYLWIAFSLAVIFLAFRLVLTNELVIDLFLPYQQAELTLLVVISTMGTLFLFLGVGVIFGRLYLAVDDYYEYSRRLLRELYIRDLPLEDLVSADNLLQAILDEYGPLRGKLEARSQLDKIYSLRASTLQKDRLRTKVEDL
jgi:hypothetical protein